MRKLLYLVPLATFIVLTIYFALNLGKDKQNLKSVLLGITIPSFNLPPIEGRDTDGFKHSNLEGDVSLVNIFGSWCVACRVEHPFLMSLKRNNNISIHGIDWREPDRLSGPAWLKLHGDPYTYVGDDPKSRAAIAFGVTGAPETFLIDKNGIIQYKHIGPLNQEIWDKTLFPVIQKLEEMK